jgi:hypothetical protein
MKPKGHVIDRQRVLERVVVAGFAKRAQFVAIKNVGAPTFKVTL